MKVYKLTDRNMRTHGGYQWTLKEVRTTSRKGPLCSAGWLHAYESPLLAVLHNPIHANIKDPRLWLADTLDGDILRGGKMKLGSSKMVLLEELAPPQVTLTQRVAYGVLCALATTQNDSFATWAKSWLSGENRSAWAAEKAEKAAWAAAWAAEAAKEAAWAAAAAKEAAWAAAWAAKEAKLDRGLDLAEIANAAMAY